MFFPGYFVAILWMVKLTEIIFNKDFSSYSIYPRTISGLAGIFFTPFLHANLDHLISNSIPLFLMGSALFYFYRSLAYHIYFWVYFLSGLGTWIIARESYHIGASGMVYGFASFIFFSGIIRWEQKLMAISLLVVFLYGGLVWGAFPFKVEISWEGHLMGGFSGLLLAIIYRKKGPQRIIYDWENEPDNDEFFNENTEDHDNEKTNDEPVIRYLFKPKEGEKSKE
jgi:membrane associated rhomboid family serine protease